MRIACTILAALLLSPLTAAPRLDRAEVLREALPAHIVSTAPEAGDIADCGATAFCFGEATGQLVPPERLFVHEEPVEGRAGVTVELDPVFALAGADVAYDFHCRLHLFVMTTETYTLTLLDPGTGSEALATGDIPRAEPTGASLSLVDFFRGRDERLHVVFDELGFTPDTSTFHRSRHWGAWNGAAWAWRVLETPEGGRTFAARVNAAGELHILNDEEGAHPYARDLVHSWHDPAGRLGHEVVREAPEQDWFYNGASIEFLPDDRPVATAQFRKTVETGSPQFDTLEFYERAADGAWSGTIIASRSDGYRGTDGDDYTGADPRLRVDDGGGLHVAFQDESLWHEGGFARGTRGQWRLAQRAPGGAWTLTTLVSQPGMTTSRDPLHSLWTQAFLVSPGAAHLKLAGLRLETDDPPRPFGDESYTAEELTLWHATDDAGRDRVLLPRVVGDILTRRRNPPVRMFPNADVNGDAVLDAADLTR